jgi:hypothetical protein
LEAQDPVASEDAWEAGTFAGCRCSEELISVGLEMDAALVTRRGGAGHAGEARAKAEFWRGRIVSMALFGPYAHNPGSVLRPRANYCPNPDLLSLTHCNRHRAPA